MHPKDAISHTSHAPRSNTTLTGHDYRNMTEVITADDTEQNMHDIRVISVYATQWELATDPDDDEVRRVFEPHCASTGACSGP